MGPQKKQQMDITVGIRELDGRFRYHSITIHDDTTVKDIKNIFSLPTAQLRPRQKHAMTPVFLTTPHLLGYELPDEDGNELNDQEIVYPVLQENGTYGVTIYKTQKKEN